MFSVLLLVALGNVVTLDATTKSVELETSSASSTDYTTSWVDNASGTITPGSTSGNVASATDTTIVPAPGSSTQRAVSVVKVCNVGSSSQTIRLLLDTSGTERVLARASLGVSECAVWDNTGAVQIRSANGTPRAVVDSPGYSGRTLFFSKTATATDAVGYWYAYLKDSGAPGAWVPGTPGLNGFFTDCSAVSNATSPVGASQMGAPYLPNPSSGGWYLSRWGVTAAIADTYRLIDVLWYNTGAVVTTTTAQGITMPSTIPARDENGSADGEGLRIGLLTTTANTNAAVINNTTVSYTNSQGTAGRTATFFALAGFQMPATPVIGTFAEFQLAAGDTGVRSIQSVTLGTSYVAGALSLLLYRPIQTDGVAVANFPSGSLASGARLNPGVRLYNGSCLDILRVGSTATTASGIYGAVAEVMER